MVGTRQVWQDEIENNGYVVDYHDGKCNTANILYDSKAMHYTLQQYGKKYGADYSKNPIYRSKTRDILVSAYDTFKNKRVIVDGIHRAVVMSSEYSDASDFSNRIVYEWCRQVSSTYDVVVFQDGNVFLIACTIVKCANTSTAYSQRRLSLNERRRRQ